MQIEQFFYWFFDSAWWISATEGTVGALVGFIGLFLAYKLTLIGDKKKRAEEITLAGAASIMKACVVLQQKKSDDIETVDMHALQNELMLFYVHQVQDRPKTAEWAAVNDRMIDFCLRDPLGKKVVHMGALMVINDLSGWLREGCPEGLLPRPEFVADDWSDIAESVKNASVKDVVDVHKKSSTEESS